MASAKAAYPRPDFSLIVAKEDGRVFTVDGATLAVFSGEGEAELFLYLAVGKEGWKVRQTSSGELISMLDGPCASAERVALDPSPEMFAERLMGLVCMGKERFVERIVSGGCGAERLAFS